MVVRRHFVIGWGRCSRGIPLGRVGGSRGQQSLGNLLVSPEVVRHLEPVPRICVSVALVAFATRVQQPVTHSLDEENNPANIYLETTGNTDVDF